MSYWIFPVVRLTFIFAPLLYLFFGLQIFVATGSEVAVYMTSYVLVSFLIQNALFARTRWPLISEVYEVAQAPYLFRAILRTVIRPRGATFNVTAKDEVLTEDYVSPIYGPLLAVFSVLTLGIAALIVRWIAFPGDRAVLQVVGGWAVFNFILVSAALAAFTEKQQRRSSPRVEMSVDATFALPQEFGGAVSEPTAAIILDASTSGMRLLVPAGRQAQPKVLAGVTVGMSIHVTPKFPQDTRLETALRLGIRSMARHVEGTVIGCEFLANPSIASTETVAHLIFGDSRRWQAIRLAYSAPKGMLAGFVYVLQLAAMGLPRSIAALAREPARLRRVAERNLHEEERPEQPAHLLAFGRFEENAANTVPAAVAHQPWPAAPDIRAAE